MTEITDGFADVSLRRRQGKEEVALCDNLDDLIDTLPAEHAAPLRMHALTISDGIRSAVVGLIAAGHSLLVTRDLLSEDDWLRYASAVTGGRKDTWCRKAIEAFEFAQAHPEIDLTRLAVGAVFELTAPSVPQQVIEQVTQRVAESDPPTKVEIHDMKTETQRVAEIDHDVDRTKQEPQIDTDVIDEKTAMKLLHKIRDAVWKAHEYEEMDQIIISMLDSLVGEIQVGEEELVGLDDVTIKGLLRTIGA